MDARLGRTTSRSPTVEATIEDDESTGRVVLVAVAAVSNRPIDELPRLYDRVDHDALDALFVDGTERGIVTFRYAGFDVVVTADGRVEVYEGT